MRKSGRAHECSSLKFKQEAFVFFHYFSFLSCDFTWIRFSFCPCYMIRAKFGGYLLPLMTWGTLKWKKWLLMSHSCFCRTAGIPQMKTTLHEPAMVGVSILAITLSHVFWNQCRSSRLNVVLLNNMYSVSAEEGWISDGGMQSLKYLNI